MEEKKINKKSKEVVKEKSSVNIKAIGITLIITTSLFFLAVLTLILLRVSEPMREWVIGNTNSITVEDENVNITVTEEENVVINVVKNSRDSVVSIAVSQLSLSKENGVVDESSNIGTGFIVDPNGIIVTNQHVVSDSTASYKVITSEGSEYDVIEIVRDNNSDIAVLKVDASELPVLELGDSDNLLVGQTVIAIGTPLGEYAGSVTTGVLSGVNRSVTTSSGWFGATAKVYENVLQTDAAVNPGNSGGPLISTEGKVIGVNFATTSGADNISFALPINDVKNRLEEYRTYGKFIKPYIGVSYQMVGEYEALYYKNVVPGALILNVDPQGPASKAGIKRTDIITKINGEQITGSLASAIQAYEVGEELELTVYNEKERTVKVTLTEAD